MQRRVQLEVWPDVEIKSSPIFPKVAQKAVKAAFAKIVCFSKYPSKKSANI